MSKFEEDMARGYLKTGEPLEALYGAGPWSQRQDEEPPIVQCHICGGQAYDYGNEIDCENCGVVEVSDESELDSSIG